MGQLCRRLSHSCDILYNKYDHRRVCNTFQRVQQLQINKINNIMNRCASRSSMTAVARLMTTNVPRSTFSKIVHLQPVLAPCFNLTINRNFSSDSPVPVHEKIDGFVKNSKVVVFMKGVPSAPQCGFSNAVVQILRFDGFLFMFYLHVLPYFVQNA